MMLSSAARPLVSAPRARITRLRGGQLRGDASALSSERSSPAGPTGRRAVQTQAVQTPASGDIRSQAARRRGEEADWVLCAAYAIGALSGTRPRPPKPQRSRRRTCSVPSMSRSKERTRASPIRSTRSSTRPRMVRSARPRLLLPPVEANHQTL